MYTAAAVKLACLCEENYIIGVTPGHVAIITVPRFTFERAFWHASIETIIIIIIIIL